MDIMFNFWLSVVVIFSLGALAHFLYDLAHQPRVLGIFTAVNESTWEHIKIAITPTLLWSLYDGYLFGGNINYFPAKFISLIVLTLVIPFVFYSYTRVSKKPILAVDILTFLAAIVLSQLTFYAIINLPPMHYWVSYLGAIGCFVFFGAYMTLTLEPVKTTIFKDPITGKYGFRAHRDFFKSLKKKSHKK